MTSLDVSLADLIARLEADLPATDELARISEAHLRAQTLSDLGDQLVGHYVDRAKQAGASWTEIGSAIGVSKQAAQQRHSSGAFDGFTELNRHSIVLAQEAARTHKHAAIGTEHLLLGLLGERAGTAYALLTAAPGSEQRVRGAVERALPPAGRKSPRGHIPFASDSKRAIDQARRAAVDLGHDHVATEHTLLGLMSVPECPAAQVLHGLGFTAAGLQEAVRSVSP